MYIRDEKKNDAECITQIQYAAFKNHPVHPPGAEPTEHRIVEVLRSSGALALSMLAEDGREPIGHIALSPAVVGDNKTGWYLLGPVGVVPSRQGEGVGSALIRESLSRLQGKGASGVVLVGDPGFYSRFGFRSLPGLSYAGGPNEYVLALSFGEDPTGEIMAHEAFRVRLDD